MAAYPTFSVNDLSEFSGRSTSEYTNVAYVPMAIKQAMLLFKRGTCLKTWPDDELDADTAKMAVLSMADAIYLAQPFQKTLSNPFSSETIGSYSYAKVTGAVLAGIPTGISWFDLAVNELSVCAFTNGEAIAGGGVEVFENTSPGAPVRLTDGLKSNNERIAGPAETNQVDGIFGIDPSEGAQYPSKGTPSGGGFAADSGELDGGSF